MVSAISPCALSFIFKPCPHEDPLKAGSIGVGCTIDRHVSVTVSQQDVGAYCHTPTINHILFNNHPIDFPTVDYVARQLTSTPLTISITSPLPLGYGFGISGASALATGYGLNTLLSLSKSATELHEIAHTTEILHKTGLGTVATQITGGFLVKTAPGLPVQAYSLPFSGQSLYLTILDKMETPSILSDEFTLEKVAHAADRAIETIQSGSHSLATIIDISYEFIQASGLPVSRQTQEVIESIRTHGGAATMAILGQVVISTQPPSLSYPYQVEHVTITGN